MGVNGFSFNRLSGDHLLRRPKRKKSHVKALKRNPFKRGVCAKVYTTKPKKPNSAVRKIAKVKLCNGRFIIASIPGQTHGLSQYSTVLVRGGRSRDLPGVRYKLVRGALDFVEPERFRRFQSRSKFGLKLPKFKRKRFKGMTEDEVF